MQKVSTVDVAVQIYAAPKWRRKDDGKRKSSLAVSLSIALRAPILVVLFAPTLNRTWDGSG